MYRKIHAVLEYLLARDRSQRKHHTLFLSLLSNFFQSCHFPVQGCLCLQSLHASGILSTLLLSPVPHCCHYLCVTFSTWVSAYQICDKLTILSFLYRIKSHGAGRSCFINLIKPFPHPQVGFVITEGDQVSHQMSRNST